MTTIGILHLMNGFGDASISWIVHRLIQNLGQRNYCWHVAGLCGRGTMQDTFRQLNVQVVDFSKSLGCNRYLSSRIRQYLIDNDIHIIHTHTLRTLYQAAMATIRLPFIIHISTKHTLTNPRDRQFGTMIAILDRLGLYLPECLVAVSQTMYEQIIAQPGLGPCRVRAISNAIPVDQFYAPDHRWTCREALGISPNEIAIGFCGRMEKVKRIDHLLVAFQQVLAEYPNVRLVMIGEGSKLNEWQALANRLSISQAVIWTGFRTDIPALLAAMDIYVQPSINEGLSLSILEAMAAGKPVIATPAGGTAEVIIDGLTGVLIPTTSPTFIAAALLDVIADPDRRSRLARTAQEFVQEKFSIANMTNGYQNLYADILKPQIGTKATVSMS